jgi:cyclopropane fatty-acyl-phospholipid synthase-like methyltransferase
MREHFGGYKPVGMDASKSMVQHAREYDPGGLYYKCDGTGKMEYMGDGICHEDEYDTVFSIVVFQHIKSSKVIHRYIQNAYRVLKPGGRFVFQILSSKFDFTRHGLMHYHSTIAIVHSMKQAGFQDHNITYKQAMGGIWEIYEGIKE